MTIGTGELPPRAARILARLAERGLPDAVAFHALTVSTDDTSAESASIVESRPTTS